MILLIEHVSYTLGQECECSANELCELIYQSDWVWSTKCDTKEEGCGTGGKCFVPSGTKVKTATTAAPSTGPGVKGTVASSTGPGVKGTDVPTTGSAVKGTVAPSTGPAVEGTVAPSTGPKLLRVRREAGAKTAAQICGACDTGAGSGSSSLSTFSGYSFTIAIV